MIRILVVSTFVLFPVLTQAYTFEEAIKQIQDHSKVKALMEKANAMREDGQVKGSWGDPMFMVNARNFPANDLRNDGDPMSGLEFGASQKVPLTTKYRHRRKSQEYLSKAVVNTAIHQQRALIQLLWNLAIKKKKALEDLDIFNENLLWVGSMLDISKRLYANGKTSQQSVLELQIRKSEIQTDISNKQHDLEHIDEKMAYLYGVQGENLDVKSIPWNQIETISHQPIESGDYRQKALEESLKANEAQLKAQKLSLVPDLTFTVSYMKREYRDMGDLVSFGFSFPLPLSSKEHAGVRMAVNQRMQAQKELHDYKWFRETELSGMKHQIQKIKDELEILDQKTIQFARQSREITSKAYGLGTTSYLELTQAELKLQNLLLHKNKLWGELSSKKVEYKYLSGDDLYAL